MVALRGSHHYKCTAVAGSLIEFRQLGRCIYGSIYDPGNPLSDENEFCKDVIKAMQELNVPW